MSVIFYEPQRFEAIAETLIVLQRTNHRNQWDSALYHALPVGMHWRVKHDSIRDAESFAAFAWAFASDLQQANVDCWNKQYRESDTLSPLVPGRTLPYAGGAHALIKSLSGVRYNMVTNAGEQISHRGAYERCAALIGALALGIVERLPAHEAAQDDEQPRHAARTGAQVLSMGQTSSQPEPAPEPQQPAKPESIDRNTAIARIRHALRKSTGRVWSVKGDRGTAWGWITISAPPRRLVDFEMTAEDRAILARALQLESVHSQGVDVPASSAHYREYVNRAEGKPFEKAEAYWD